MKKLVLALALVVGAAGASFASNYKLNEASVEIASAYQLNEQQIDASFEQSEDWSSKLFAQNPFISSSNFNHFFASENAEDIQQTAAIVAIASAVIGYFTVLPLLFPTHRFILGTGGNSVAIWAIYCFTLSGLGWLNIIDAVFLLMDDSKAAYVNSGKIILWLGEK